MLNLGYENFSLRVFRNHRSVTLSAMRGRKRNECTEMSTQALDCKGSLPYVLLSKFVPPTESVFWIIFPLNVLVLFSKLNLILFSLLGPFYYSNISHFSIICRIHLDPVYFLTEVSETQSGTSPGSGHAFPLFHAALIIHTGSHKGEFNMLQDFPMEGDFLGFPVT